MKTLATLSLSLAACLSGPRPYEAPDAGTPPTCTSTVIAVCGPRPPRPSVSSEVWEHDIDLWAKCAEWAAPILGDTGAP